jgi:hypothetical protein
MLMKPRLRLIALAATLGLAALPALALTPLNQEKHVNDTLISAGIADQIRKNCSSVNARMLRALSRAKKLGYSETEVKAFLRSPTEKKRVKDAINNYLAENGVVKGDEAAYCSLGRAEIAKRSLVGQLLWTW